DDLQRIQIVEGILNKQPYDSALFGARHYPTHVVSTISELKRGLYTPESLRDLAESNIAEVKSISPKIAQHLEDTKRFPSNPEKSLELFNPIADMLESNGLLSEVAHESLMQAMATASDESSSKPLTAWKNDWLKKDSENRFTFTDPDQHIRMVELSKVFGKYQAALEKEQLYDFDDMIIKSINALKANPELRFNLQEKYQFILLDEFQDTNAAQFDLVNQLADNPVNEGKPNIFAVGDDDQAIYAFQGARVSNMISFTKSFEDVAVINLHENYRSHADIIHTAHNISEQIESRLHHGLEGVSKTLTASAQDLPKDSQIERHEFSGGADENAWVADKIKELITAGANPDEIAILAPKHKFLENIVPFLSKVDVPVSYEKREDILQTPLMRAFKSIASVLIAARDDNTVALSELLPQILSLDFYQVPVKQIWQVNWQHRTRDDDRSWAEIAMDNEILAPHVLFLLSVGLKIDQEPLEYILDYLTGNSAVQLDADTPYTSPLRDFYFSDRETNTLQYYEMLTNLSTIRERLRAHQQSSDKHLNIDDFLDYFAAYEIAGQPLINSHPISQNENSVHLMTVYKAKGLEFKHVFLLSVHDDVWGKKARSNSSKLSLPANLQHVRYQGSSEDELRRILFVAITRAKQGLYLTSHALKDSGKTNEAVKYLLEYEEDGHKLTHVLPEGKQKLSIKSYSAEQAVQHIDTMWNSRHLNLTADLKSLLMPRLDKYQMSPTHLNTFIDMEYGGPESFLLYTLLRFPQAPGEDGEFGNAIHASLEIYQKRIESGQNTTLKKLLSDFDAILDRRYIISSKLDDYRARGHKALSAYLAARTDMFKQKALTEVDFRKEGVLVGDAHLSGKIDRLEIDKASKTVSIIDFKTGKPHAKWERSVKLLKYKQQLYFYKILIEGSHSYKNYKVSEARLEFVEPDSNGKILEPLVLKFDHDEEKEMKQLIQSVWNLIKSLDLPDTSTFSRDYRGSSEIINFLIK
ncbi:MAG: DNA helicase-2/ATP-dependent DNA helicase PcrA, partial [Candidatus Saccharimonadales bacterium]